MSDLPSVPDNLDPADWQAYRDQAHALLDKALDHAQGSFDRPVWQPVPDEIKAGIAEAVPMAGTDISEVGAAVTETIMPYATGNTHPRFFGWVHGTGTAGGIVAEMLAAAMNANLGGRDHAPVYVERQVIDWCRQIFGFPDQAGGLIVSGTSMGTFLSLAIARHDRRPEIATSGMTSLDQPLIIYTSTQAHNSVTKAALALGFGTDQVRAIAVDATGGMDMDLLAQSIATDKAQGCEPFCIVGSAGTVNTGEFDDLTRAADIAATEGLWLHVDGAFGALVILAESHKHLVAGIERADSLAFDFHKWLHVPYAAGCMLIRDQRLQLAAFSDRPDYLAEQARGLAGGAPWFCEMGIELSRGFAALKVWFTLKEQGFTRLGRMIAKNCAQARYLAERVEVERDLQLMNPNVSNITCFRYCPIGGGGLGGDGLDNAALDRINAEIVMRLQEKGIAAPSTTKLSDVTAIRVNITNHRTEMADIDLLIDAVLIEANLIVGEF